MVMSRIRSFFLHTGRHRQAGFTLTELLVSIIVLTEVLVAALLLFDLNNKLSRAQTNIAEVQQSVRAAQHELLHHLRAAGRGGFPLGLGTGSGDEDVFSGLALAVRNNVDANETIALTDSTSPTVLEGTDVLTIRGVFSSSLFQVDTRNQRAPNRSFSFDAADPSLNFVIVANETPYRIPQDTQPLEDAITDGVPEALLIVSPRSDATWAVVELDPDNSSVVQQDIDGDGTDEKVLTLRYRVDAGINTASYVGLRGPAGFPRTEDGVVFVGILEELRYYVREDFAVANDPTSDLVPRLSRARFFPNTDVARDANALREDIADYIFDLQVSLGFDSTNAGAMADDADDDGDDDRIVETADGETDDWLFNAANDDATEATWTSQLHYVRLSTVARTDRADPKHLARRIDDVEDHSYTGHLLNDETQRRFRRRVLQTVVDLRNM